MSQFKSIQDPSPVWMPVLSRQAGPRFLQIADALQAAIAAGSLKAGDRLPPQRQLATHLNIDLTTVTRAYDEARRRHLLEGRGARGTYVAAPKAELTPVLDLSMNTPPPPHGVDVEDMLKQGLSQVLMRTDNTQLMTYQLAGGSEEHRQAAADWLAPAFGKTDAQHWLICPGAQAAIAALILAETSPGDVILTEPVCYPGLHAAAMQLGRRVMVVDTDQHGMLPAQLENACLQYRARSLYLNPTLQNPTTTTMPETRRRAIAAIVQKYGLLLIEDDPYWLLADQAPPPLASLAPEQVCYISTLSKTLMPGLRVAFVLIRNAQRRDRFLAALKSFAQMTPPLMAALATQWIRDGSAKQLLQGVRAEAHARHQSARQILAGYECGSPEALHLWLLLPPYWNASELADAAQVEGIVVTPADAFMHSGDTINAIRISLGSLPDRQRLRTGLQKLSRLLAHVP